MNLYMRKSKEKSYGNLSPFKIFVDQAGYLPERKKTAVVPFPAEFFDVIDENGDKHFQGKVIHFGIDECSGDSVYIADFSEFKRPGSYRISADGKTSALFRISEGVYRKLFFETSKAFYYLRCGCILDEKYAGVYTHARCHCKEAEYIDEGIMEKITGGWHDAGDYGRYVTAGSVAAAHLLYTYKMFPHLMDSFELNIPETGSGFPDILSECRYELEWLLKMQRSDGAVHHKETTMRHASFVMPEKDNAKMYIFTISSYATADFCAVCALAAGIFANYDSEFSGRLKRAAVRAYNWLEEHPEMVGFYNPDGCDTGMYSEDNDIDNRYWAAAEMYALTGEERYHKAFRSLYASPYFEGRSFIKTSLGYMHTGGFGSLAYMLCTWEDKDNDLADELKNVFISEACWIRDKSRSNGYGAAMEDWEFFWGSNMVLLHNGIKCIIANMITSRNEFYDCALEQLHVLLGRNALGISYVIGTGEFSSNHPHYRPSIADSIEKSIPGFVIGGPNRDLSDPYAKEIIPQGTPPMKCYADDERCYSLNEVTVYWNSSAVFLLAAIESREAGDWST